MWAQTRETKTGMSRDDHRNSQGSETSLNSPEAGPEADMNAQAEAGCLLDDCWMFGDSW